MLKEIEYKAKSFKISLAYTFTFKPTIMLKEIE